MQCRGQQIAKLCPERCFFEVCGRRAETKGTSEDRENKSEDGIQGGSECDDRYGDGESKLTN